MKNLLSAIASGVILFCGFNAQAQKPYGARLEGFTYPFATSTFSFDSQQNALEMVYMDVKPEQHANGKTVVFLHGKNFCAATWQSAMKALVEQGYRVIAVDQVGFCKSSKPERYQFSFAQLAANTHALLQSLNIDQSIMVAHSMGGMLGVRYALQYPQQITQLVLVNPIGLEDWKAKGVPWVDINTWYEKELKTTADSIRNYQKTVYYNGSWKPEYQQWVDMLAGMYAGSGKQRVAWNQALASDMVLNQPVIYEFENVKTPTTLIIGQLDRTAFGKDLVTDKEKANALGNYVALGKSAARKIPNATLIEFEQLGHSPQVEDPKTFNAALLSALSADTNSAK